MSREALQEAYGLIRDGHKAEAAQLLVPIVRAEPSNADAWWLLANALDNPEQQRRALERVLSLRPDDERAQAMLERLLSPLDKRKNDEPFDFDDLEQRVRRRRGTNPITLILAAIGLITVLSCGLCLVGAAVSFPSFRQVFQQVILTITAVPVGQLVIGTPAPQTIPSDLQQRGSIEPGQKRNGTVDVIKPDGWTFQGDAGEKVVIEADAKDPNVLDPQLALYDTNGMQIAENDDIDGANNRNARITFTLPGAGRYTVAVSAFGTGGDYTLTLTRGG